MCTALEGCRFECSVNCSSLKGFLTYNISLLLQFFLHMRIYTTERAEFGKCQMPFGNGKERYN